MAIAFDASQGTNQAAAGATTIALTTANPVASGGLCIVCVSADAGTLNSISDGTNNYTLLTAASSSLEKIWVGYFYYASGLASSSTITATFSASQGDRMIGAFSFTGTASSSILDVQGQRNNIFNETNWVGSPLTTVANAVVLAFSATAGAGNPANTAGTDYTEAIDWSLSGGQKSACAVYRLAPPAGSNQPLGTWSTDQTGAEQSQVTASFKVASGSGSPVTLTPATSTNTAQALSYNKVGSSFSPPQGVIEIVAEIIAYWVEGGGRSWAKIRPRKSA
jgi:hypothetical protein